MSKGMVCVFKIDAAIRNPSVAGPEFRDKHKGGRPKRERERSKRERGRYISEAAPRFGNLCVYEPSALRKKPSGLRRSRAANAFRKGVPNRGINFKDAYRMSIHVFVVRIMT